MINKSPYDLVTALRTVKSVEKIANAAGVSVGTIKRIGKYPMATVNHATYSALVRLYESERLSPFPAYTDQLHRYLDQVMAKADTESNENLMRHFDLLLIPRIKLDPEYSKPTYAGVRLQWLLGHVYFEYAKLSRSAKKKQKYEQLAEKYYNQAISSLKSLDDDKNKALYIGKISLTLFALHFNAKPRKTRTTDPDIINWLSEFKLLDRAQALLDIEPTNYMVARNGLVGASILKDTVAINTFADILLKRFPDALEPGVVSIPELPPLSEDPDLVFAYQYLIEYYNVY